jgi:hypothetical protein
LHRIKEKNSLLIGLYQSLELQSKSEQAKEAKQRFEKAWASADVALTGSRF